MLYAYKLSVEKSYKEEFESFENYKAQASKLIVLQNRWSNKEEDKKILQSIKSRFKPSSYTKDKNLHILKFENISKSTLRRLGKTLLNSNLTLKKLYIKRDDKRVSLHVEVQI